MIKKTRVLWYRFYRGTVPWDAGCL